MFRYYIDLGHTLASALPLFPREKSGSRARDQGVYVTLLDFARIFSVPRFSRIVESEIGATLRPISSCLRARLCRHVLMNHQLQCCQSPTL